MGSDEGGLEELVGLSFRRASRSQTRCSSSRTRPLTESKTARMAIWASGGTVFQSDSGMGGRGIILLILRAYHTKGSARERALDFVKKAIIVMSGLTEEPPAALKRRYEGLTDTEQKIAYSQFAVAAHLADEHNAPDLVKWLGELSEKGHVAKPRLIVLDSDIPQALGHALPD